MDQRPPTGRGSPVNENPRCGFAPDVARLESADGGFQAAFIQRLEGVPVQAGEAADMADRRKRPAKSPSELQH